MTIEASETSSCLQLVEPARQQVALVQAFDLALVAVAVGEPGLEVKRGFYWVTLGAAVAAAGNP